MILNNYKLLNQKKKILHLDQIKNCNIKKKIHESMGHIEEINNLLKGKEIDSIIDFKGNSTDSSLDQSKSFGLLFEQLEKLRLKGEPMPFTFPFFGIFFHQFCFFSF